MGWDGTTGTLGGHGRKATTHSLTLYAVKLLGNDFVTLLVPQRSPLPFNKDMNSCGRDSFFERVTDIGEDARLVACILRREGASAFALSACR